MKIYDVILIFFLLMISFIPTLFLSQNVAKTAVITVDGKLYKRVNLKTDDNFIIKTDDGENIVEVKNNSIAIIHADCRDQICVKEGAISKKGEVIACSPHKILIEISDEDD